MALLQILVTNQLQRLSHPAVDKIIFLEAGAVVNFGSWEALMKMKSGKFRGLIESVRHTVPAENKALECLSDSEQARKESAESTKTPKLHTSKEAGNDNDNGIPGNNVKSVELFEDEEKYTGGVSSESYTYLVNSMSPHLLVLAVSLTCVSV